MPARRLFSLSALLLLLVGGCSGPSSMPTQNAAAGRTDATVYKGFTLIDGTDSAPRPDAAMVVENGRIAWIGSQEQLQAPAGAQTVELAGKFVMPGLMDLHVHLAVVDGAVFNEKVYTQANVEKALRTYASYGVTTVLVEGTDKDLIFAIVKEQRAGRPSLTRVYTAGQGIVFKGGYGGVPGINEPVASVEEAERAVVQQRAKGVDVIKLWVDDEFGTMPKMPAEISNAVIDAAHRENLRAVAHLFYLEDAKRLIGQGVDGLVHSVRDRPIDQALIDSMKAHGAWSVSETLSREAAMFAYGGRAPFLDDPFFTRAVAPEVLAQLASPERQAKVAAGPHYGHYRPILDTAKANLKTLADAGVNYAFGTDSGPPGRFPGYSAHWELELMVEAGLTPAQALQAATRRGAEFLGAKDLGTLEQAKWADFIVLDADPLADIKNSRALHSVYIAGQRVESTPQTEAVATSP